MMKGETEGSGDTRETLQEVLERASEAGFDVSERQLKRWRDEGLVPSPEKVGLGRGKGTVSLYPEGTGERLVAVARALDDQGTLGAAGLKLWMQGADLTEYVRDLLLQIWADHVETTDKLLRAYDSGLTEEPVKSWVQRERLRRFGWIRKAVGKQEFGTVVYYVLAAMAGRIDADDLRREIERDPELRVPLRNAVSAIYERVTGLAIEEWQEGEVANLLVGASRQMSYRALLERGRAREEEEWRELRDQALKVTEEYAPDAEGEERLAMAMNTFLHFLTTPSDRPDPDQVLEHLADQDDDVADRIADHRKRFMLNWEI